MTEKDFTCEFEDDIQNDQPLMERQIKPKIYDCIQKG
jgi:hypothetical protein